MIGKVGKTFKKYEDTEGRKIVILEQESRKCDSGIGGVVDLKRKP